MSDMVPFTPRGAVPLHHVLRLELSNFGQLIIRSICPSVSRHFAILTNADTFVPFLASPSVCIAPRFACSRLYSTYAVVARAHL